MIVSDYLNIRGISIKDKIFLWNCYIKAGFHYIFNRKKFITVGQFLNRNIIVKDKNKILYYVRAHSEDLGYVAGNTKPETKRWFIPKKNEVIIDVGASVGKFSLFAARIGANVIAIEPHPLTYEILKRNIELNNFPNIKALNIAMGKEEGKAELYSPKNFFGRASLISDWEARFNQEKFLVDVLPLDDITVEINRIDWLLIDVEGFEYEVLQGARKTLEKTNKIIIEISSKNINIIPEFLETYNFKVKEAGGMQEKIQYYFFEKH